MNLIVVSIFSQVNTLWGSFEINNVRLIKMMLQQFARSLVPFSDAMPLSAWNC